MNKIQLIILFLLVPALSLAAPMATLNCAQTTSTGEVICDVALNEPVTLSSIQFQVVSGWEVVSGVCPAGANSDFYDGKLACSTGNDITTTSLGTFTLSIPADMLRSQVTINQIDVTDSSFSSISIPEVSVKELVARSEIVIEEPPTPEPRDSIEIGFACGTIVVNSNVECTVVSSPVTISAVEYNIVSDWEIVSATCPTGANADFFGTKLACSTADNIQTNTLGVITLKVPDVTSEGSLTINGLDVTDSKFSTIDIGRINPKRLSVTKDISICTQESKECSDGSFVFRSGAECEFSACPEPTGISRDQYEQEMQKIYDEEKEIIDSGSWTTRLVTKLANAFKRMFG